MTPPAGPTAEEPPGGDRGRALRQRLEATAGALALPADVHDAGAGGGSSRLYRRLIDHVHGEPGTEGLWLLMTAMCAAMPDPDELMAAMRARDLTGAADFGRWLLTATFDGAAGRGATDLEMDVVTGAVLVDVDFTATHELHTGIQRVVRETVPRWGRDRDVTLVAWTAAGGALRHLSAAERDRVLRWNDPDRPAGRGGVGVASRLVVPWRSSVVLPEAPSPDHCPELAALASYSGSTLSLIGYDCIPVISPELIHVDLPDRFARYLQAVKHAHRVAGISAAATQEFRGFVDMLPAQGLTGPDVVECTLPVEVPAGDPVAQEDPPLVVSIGSFEPRKNQIAVLHAAEQLWRAGLRFRMEFIGGSGYTTEFDALMSRLRRGGRPVRARTAVSDTELWRTVRSARFTVFVSLHEGFGLPVAESLACGTPCLTSDYGSTREIADGGGALVVDPLDDLAVADQMRRLLTDDELLATLRKEAAQRPPRTWDDYARELWAALVPAAGPVS